MVTDERLAGYTRFMHDIDGRVFKGSLDPESVMDQLRPLIGQTAKTNHAIKLGTFKSWETLETVIERTGMELSEYAKAMTSKTAITLASQTTEAKLVVRKVMDLGFTEGAYYNDICARSKELKLELCPAEVGPQLRLQYKEQPQGEWLVIAMEPIADDEGDLRLFTVQHLNGLCIDAFCGKPDYWWSATTRFVFLVRK